MSVINQLLGSFMVSYFCMTIGAMFTWPSSTFQLFGSTNTTLNRPMTQTELSLFGSISSISALISTPCTGILINGLGRKYSCILMGLLQLSAWIIIATCYYVEAILAACFISGLSVCLVLIVSVYVSEFCQESVRGMMTAFPLIFFGVGMVVSYILGGTVSYDTMTYVCLSLTVSGIVLINFMKESPLYLMTKGLEEEAAKVIAFYRRAKVDSKLVIGEVENIRRLLNPELDDSPEEEKLKPESNTKEKLSVLQFLRKSRASRRELFICIVLYSAVSLQGLVVIQVYAEPLFQEAIPSMSATVSSVTFSVLSVATGFLGAYLVDVIGRRPLMIYGSLGTALCCAVLGSQIQMHWGPHWVTALLIYIYCITYTLSAGTVPYVVVAEVFLPEIKSFASMVAVEWAIVCNFVILFIFNPVVEALGLGPVFYIFGFFSLASAVLCVFYLPETKGLTVDLIQEKFAKKKIVLPH